MKYNIVQLTFACLTSIIGSFLILFILENPESPLGSGCIVGIIALFTLLSNIFSNGTTVVNIENYTTNQNSKIENNEPKLLNTNNDQNKLFSSNDLNNLIQAEIEIKELKEEITKLNQKLSDQKLLDFDQKLLDDE